MKTTAAVALKALTKALRSGTVRFHRPHAIESILACGVNTHLVLRELQAAAEAGAVRPNRSVPGRFIAHGAIVKVSFVLAEPQPGVLVITVMLIE